MFRRNVNVFNVLAQRQDEFPCLARSVAFVNDVTVFVQLNVGLSDNVLIFFPRRQIKRPRFSIGLTSVRSHALVRLRHLFARNMLAWLKLRVASVDDSHVLNHTSVGHLPIGRLNKAKLIDASKARQTRNQADVRTFRRLYRTDAPIVSRVHVAHFKPRPLTRESTRPQG